MILKLYLITPICSGHTKVWTGVYKLSSGEYVSTEDFGLTISDYGTNCQAIKESTYLNGNDCNDIYPFICTSGKGEIKLLSLDCIFTNQWRI